MQQQARTTVPQAQIPQPAPTGMQTLTGEQLRAVVGGPLIKNGGIGLETDSTSGG